MRVKPAPGLKVRDPKSMKFIPEEGIELKELNTYWVRRIQDGDVLEVPSQEPTEEKKPAAAKASAKPGNGGGK